MTFCHLKHSIKHFGNPCCPPLCLETRATGTHLVCDPSVPSRVPAEGALVPPLSPARPGKVGTMVQPMWVSHGGPRLLTCGDLAIFSAVFQVQCQQGGVQRRRWGRVGCHSQAALPGLQSSAWTTAKASCDRKPQVRAGQVLSWAGPLLARGWSLSLGPEERAGRLSGAASRALVSP